MAAAVLPRKNKKTGGEGNKNFHSAFQKPRILGLSSGSNCSYFFPPIRNTHIYKDI